MRRLALAGALAAGLLAGCGGGGGGGSDRQDQRVHVLADFAVYEDAFLAKDAAAACEQLTGRAKREFVEELALVAEDGLSCESVLKGAMDLLGPEDYAQARKARETLEPADVKLSGDRAEVHLPSGRINTLRRLGGTWYVDGVDSGGS